MKYFRSFLVILSFIIFGICSLFLNFLIFPLAEKILKNDGIKNKYINFSSKIIHKSWGIFVNFLIFIKLIKLDIKDKEKLQNIKGKVIVATHPSYIDILILMALIPKTTCFVKSKLAQNFVFKNIVNSIFITNDTDLDIIKTKTKELFDNDFNIIIFPTGQRHRKNEYPKIKKGASLVALTAQKDIVPVQIFSSEDFLFINQPFYQGGKKTVIFDINVKDEIKVEGCLFETEIIAKKQITKQITHALYNM